MAGFILWIICFSLLVFVYASSIKSRREKSKALPRPPGPKPLPLIGNALDIPREKGWLTYIQWGKRYNTSLVYARASGQHLLIINRVEDAEELPDHEKRAQLTSSRPQHPLLTLMGMNTHTALMKYGDTWRRHRKLIQRSLRKDVLSQHEIMIQRKATEYLHKLANDPENFLQHAKIFNSAIIMDMLYGYNLVSHNDPFFRKAEDVVRKASHALIPGVFLVDTFPFLRYLPAMVPGAGFHNYAADVAKQSMEVRDIPFEQAKKGQVDGSEKPCLVAGWLQGKEELDGAQEEVLRDVAASVFEAGLDTTSSAMSSWFLAMIVYPEVQKKAQEEIDRIVGIDRLPNLQDRPFLPYLEAIYRETLRWAMTRNEATYPDPETFRPERFLYPDGSLNRDEPSLAFGFGRRICPGKYLAFDAFWLAAAQVFSTFNLSRVKDDHGKNIELSMEFTDEGISRPEPFPCSIVLRKELRNLPARI